MNSAFTERKCEGEGLISMQVLELARERNVRAKEHASKQESCMAGSITAVLSSP